MDFGFSPEEEKFREEVREWLREEPPSKFKLDLGDEGYGSWGASLEYSRRLGAKGWLVPTWPKEYGGQGRSAMEKLILIEELATHRAPTFAHFNVELFGPVIMLFGTEEQRGEFMPPLARGEKILASGLSEPGAGSDAAAIATRAVEDGDHYLINGQKVWTSLAHLADYCWITAITDPAVPPQKGMSIFIFDMKTPGISIRPLVDMAGKCSFNEIFFDDVRVPGKNLIGEKNKGWPQLMTALDSERCWTRGGMPWYLGEVLKDLVGYVREVQRDGQSLAQNLLIRQKLAQLAVEIEACRLLQYRVVWMQSRGILPNYESSIVKVCADELGQRVAKVGGEILGLFSQLEADSKWVPLEGQIEHMVLNSIGRTIAAGTSEIQRNIIALRGLQLPRG